MFDFDNFPIKLSGKTVNYICPKCKYKFEAPIEAVLEFDKRMNEKVYLFLFLHILSVKSVSMINVYTKEDTITFIKKINLIYIINPKLLSRFLWLGIFLRRTSIRNNALSINFLLYEKDLGLQKFPRHISIINVHYLSIKYNT